MYAEKELPLITVPKVLRDKLGEDGADALVALINQADTQLKVETLTFVEEKFERRLHEEIGKVMVEFAKVRQEMAGLKADLIRWMFLFWIGQLGAMLGILFAFFRK